ncbi:MAG: nuclease superfamily protein [Candidatus Berkelbacteria bacterium]|nr:nuclease superfamily protein [Candidatus Berkelbacteria bacterium]
MYYVYILHLKKDNKLYTGSTSDLRKRLKNHISNKVLSTQNRNPALIHYEVYICKSDAQRRERFLKMTEGKRLLRQQIRDILIKIKYI